MNHKSILPAALLIAMSFFLFVPHQAYAYIDPGSGSVIWQVVIATLLSGTFLIKTYWHKLKRLVGRTEVSQEEGLADLDNQRDQD